MSDERAKAIKWAETYLSRDWDTALNDDGIEGLSIKGIARTLIAEVAARDAMEASLCDAKQLIAADNAALKKAEALMKDIEKELHHEMVDGQVALSRSVTREEKARARIAELEVLVEKKNEALRRAILFGELVIGKKPGEINWTALEFSRVALSIKAAP